MTQLRKPISEAPKTLESTIKLRENLEVRVGKVIWLYDATQKRRGRWREAFTAFDTCKGDSISREAQWVTEDGAALGFEPTEWAEDR